MRLITLLARLRRLRFLLEARLLSLDIKKIFQEFGKYSFKYKETIAALYGEILEKESGMLSAQPRAKT